MPNQNIMRTIETKNRQKRKKKHWQPFRLIFIGNQPYIILNRFSFSRAQANHYYNQFFDYAQPLRREKCFCTIADFNQYFSHSNSLAVGFKIMHQHKWTVTIVTISFDCFSLENVDIALGHYSSYLVQ